MKIWVVDDDPAICSLLKIVLSGRGHEVETYSDPTATPVVQDRPSACTSEPPCADVMLVDYSMPKMNGLDFLKLLEEQGCPTLRANKAIITAYATGELCQELDRLGVKYFRKPFRFPDIVRWLDDCACRLGGGGGTRYPGMAPLS